MSTTLIRAKRGLTSRLEGLRGRLQTSPRLRFLVCGLTAHLTVYQGLSAVLIALGTPLWFAELVALVSALEVARRLEEALMRQSGA